MVRFNAQDKIKDEKRVLTYSAFLLIPRLISIVVCVILTLFARIFLNHWPTNLVFEGDWQANFQGLTFLLRTIDTTILMLLQVARFLSDFELETEALQATLLHFQVIRVFSGCFHKQEVLIECLVAHRLSSTPLLLA
jgi:hypothetical protein